jgi:uncharacterized protein YjeT (DUF2065 family)
MVFWSFLFVGVATVLGGLMILAPWWRSGRQVTKLEFGPKYDLRLAGEIFIVIGSVMRALR